MNRNTVAAKVAKNKAAHPERYCSRKGCLWALRSGPCPKHDPAEREFVKAFTPNKYGEYA